MIGTSSSHVASITAPLRYAIDAVFSSTTLRAACGLPSIVEAADLLVEVDELARA